LEVHLRCTLCILKTSTSHKLYTVRTASGFCLVFFFSRKRKVAFAGFQHLRSRTLSRWVLRDGSLYCTAAGFHSDLQRKTKPTGLRRGWLGSGLSRRRPRWYLCDGTELGGVTPTTLLGSHAPRLAAGDPSRAVEEKIHNQYPIQEILECFY